MASVIAKSLFIPKCTRGNYETAYLVIKLRMEENESETGFDNKKHLKDWLKHNAMFVKFRVFQEPRNHYSKSFNFELANLYNFKLLKRNIFLYVLVSLH